MSHRVTVVGVLLGLLFIAALVWLWWRVATTAEANAKRRWPERCVQGCRSAAAGSCNPREAMALCLEGCP